MKDTILEIEYPLELLATMRDLEIKLSFTAFSMGFYVNRYENGKLINTIQKLPQHLENYYKTEKWNLETLGAVIKMGTINKAIYKNGELIKNFKKRG